MLLPGSTSTDPAFSVTPAPAHLPFTWAELLIDCMTMEELPVTTSAPVTLTVAPPPMVSVAPLRTVMVL